MFRIITKSLAGRITKNLTVVSAPPVASPFYPVLPYSSLNDADLSEPGGVPLSDILIPATSLFSDSFLAIHLKYNSSGLFWGGPNSVTAGAISDLPNYPTAYPYELPTGFFFTPSDDRNFASFASDGNDGLITILFGKNVVGDNLGGEIVYYYKYSAWLNAVSDDTAQIYAIFEVYQNGSVYKRVWNDILKTIGSPSLVVRWDGALGPAGGGSATDVPRPMISSLPASPYTTLGDAFLNSPEEFMIGEYLLPAPINTFIPVLGRHPSNGDWFQLLFSIGNLYWVTPYTGGVSESDLGTTIDYPGVLDYETPNFTVLSGFTIDAENGLKQYPEESDNFANSSLNGLKNIYFSKSSVGDMLGGFASYYYHHDAWVYACEVYAASETVSTSVLEIYQNGSVYVRDRSNPSTPAILVVRWDGEVGPGGSATPDVTEDIPRPI